MVAQRIILVVYFKKEVFKRGMISENRQLHVNCTQNNQGFWDVAPCWLLNSACIV